MHDMSLGPPVDVGVYCGPLLDGKPLHPGNCEDGVYGCRSCNATARTLDVVQLKEIGWATSIECDWCLKSVPTEEVRGYTPVDEPCYYEICDECYNKRHVGDRGV